MKNLKYVEAMYLKSAGKNVDVKVTLRPTEDGFVNIYMRDFEFNNFQAALQFLRHVGSTEIYGVAS